MNTIKRIIFSLVALCFASGAHAVSPIQGLGGTPTSITNAGATVSTNSNGSITQTTAAGQPLAIFGANVRLDSPSVLTFGAQTTPAVSGATDANIFWDGSNLYVSRNGASYVRFVPMFDGNANATFPAGITLAGHIQNSFTSLASDPAVFLTGSWFTGGTGTTNFPHLLLQATGTTASTTWSTVGTAIGVNAVTGFTGNLIDTQVAGVTKFSVTGAGLVTTTTAGGVTMTSRWKQLGPADGVFQLQNSSSAGATIAGTPTTPTQITADQNDYTPTSPGYYQRWSSDASRNVTGLTFSGGKISGETLVIVNVGSNNIVIVNESASSTAVNRFHNSTGADITLAADSEVNCWYDGTTARWRVTKRGF